MGIRVLLVDDHPLFLRGVAAALELEADLEIVECATTGKRALELHRSLKPDVTVMDISLTPEMTGIVTIEAICRQSPNARIVVLSALEDEETICAAIRAGAATYQLKAAIDQDLAAVIRKVHAGHRDVPIEVSQRIIERIKQPGLSGREIEVLKLAAEGLANKEIAARLSIKEQTIEFHMKNIRGKLGANDRTGAVTAAIRRGIIDIRKHSV